MNTAELITFLGQSSSHAPLDDFLLQSGIQKRPKKVESSVDITDREETLVLTFKLYEAYLEDCMEPPSSEGRFILQEVTFEDGFKSPLPYGVEFSMTPAQVQRALGPPLEEDSHTSTHAKDGRLVIGHYKAGRSAMDWLRVWIPTKHDKARGLTT